MITRAGIVSIAFMTIYTSFLLLYNHSNRSFYIPSRKWLSSLLQITSIIKYFLYCLFKRNTDKEFFATCYNFLTQQTAIDYFITDTHSLIFLPLDTGWYWPFKTQLGMYTKCVSDTSSIFLAIKAFRDAYSAALFI